MSPRTQPTVVALCGSLRAESRTRIALGELLAGAEREGARTKLVDLRAYDVPTLNAVDADGSDVEQLRETVERADSLALGTPNYHGSYSGALKNVLDHCSRDDLEGTTVGLLEVAAGEFPGSAITHLRCVCRTLHAWPLPTAVAIPDSHSLVTEEGIDDPALAERTHRLGRELVAYAGVNEYPDAVNQGSPTARKGEALD